MKSKHYIWLITLIAIILIIQAKPVLAQEGTATGNLIINVSDEQGQVIQNAVIVAKNPLNGFTYQTQINQQNLYNINSLPPGIYQLKVQAEGFATQIAPIIIELGTKQETIIILKTGNKEEKPITTKLTLDSYKNRTEGSVNMSLNFFGNLPIFRRNFLDLVVLAPRVTPDRYPIPPVIANSRLSFNGQSARFNNFKIDGLENNDRATGTTRSNFIQGTIQEFQIVTNNFSAEHGRSLGGFVNAVTKSGINEYHGGLFSFISNDKVSARDAYALRLSFRDFEQYQSGVNLTGPLKKDKVFFLVSAGRFSSRQENVVNISDEDVASANRQGFPLRNGPVPFSIGATSGFLRLDTQITPNNKAWARYNGNFFYNGAFQGFGDIAGETTGVRQYLQDQTIALSNTYSRPTNGLVNETRVLLAPRKYDTLPINAVDNPQIVVQDIVAENPNGRVLIYDFEKTIVFNNDVLLPQPFSNRLTEFSFQIVNNTTINVGSKQEVKFGIDFARYARKSRFELFDKGQAIFTPLNFFGPSAPPINAREAFDPSLRTSAQRAFLTNLARQYRQTLPGFPLLPLADLSLPLVFNQGFGDKTAKADFRLFGVYLQDNIRVKPNFLLKLGIRYDRNQLRVAPANNGEISPRIAFSYNPSKFSKLNIKAGYGLFFATPILGPTQPSSLLGTNRFLLYSIPFPFSVLPLTLPSRHLPITEGTFPQDATFVPQLTTTAFFDKNFKDSYSQQANLSFTYAADRNTVISLEYSYVRGLRIFYTRDINPVVRNIPGDELTSQIVGRVDPTQGELLEIESAFDSYYSGLTVGVNRKFANKFSVLAHYTWSKTIDNYTDFTAGARNDSIQDGAIEPNLRAERALSSQDVRSRFLFSGVWDLNYTKNPILTGFQLSTIVTLESGRPYNITRKTSVIVSRGAISRTNFRPNGLSRNLGITPGFATVDFRLTRNIKITEKVSSQLRIDVFNAFNRVNIRNVNSEFLPDENGVFRLPPQKDGRFVALPEQFRGSFAPRQVQFGIAITF